MEVLIWILTHKALSIVIISFLISLFTLLVTKLFTDQKKLKELREEMNRLQKEIKKESKNQKRVLELQKEIMGLNAEYMQHSFRVTLITIIPLVLILGWMRNNLAYDPISPNTPLQLQVKVGDPTYNNISLELWKKGINKGTNNTLISIYEPTYIDSSKKIAKFLIEFPDYGDYFLKVNVIGLIGNTTKVLDTAIKEVVVDKYKYVQPIQSYKNPYIREIKVLQKETQPFGSFSLFGWHPGWFALYFVSSLVFVLLLKKLLKVY